MLRRSASFFLDSARIAFLETLSRRGRLTRWPMRRSSRIRFRPQVGLLEGRALLSAQPTLTALVASTASASAGQSVTFTSTVSDLTPGGATPSGGSVTFSDAAGAIDSVPLNNGVARLTTSSLPPGTITVTASYSGTTDFAPSTTGTIVTAAGDGKAGYTGDGGPATAAELNGEAGIAIDSAGDLFIADYNNNVVREVVAATGDIDTVAGDGKAGYSGDGGAATSAELNHPRDVAVDPAGDLFFADMDNNAIREVVATTGDIITVAGDGKAGYTGDNGPATSAELNLPRGIAVDPEGDLFFADYNNNAVREVVEATGDIITVAGDGKAGGSGDNGPATAAELNNPNDVTVNSAGDLFIADQNNNAVREVVKATGDIIAVAGDGKAGYTGDGGPAAAAELNNPLGVSFDSAGDLFIADGGDNAVREVIAATGDIVTVAGDGKAGYSGDGGPATAAELSPLRIAVDPEGGVFVSDPNNNVVREFTAAATLTISPSSTPAPPVTPPPTSSSSSSSSTLTPTLTPGVFLVSTSHSVGAGSLTPASAPRFVTRMTLATHPRSPMSGRRVTLIASVRSHGGPRDVPTGWVAFLDGTTDLGTVPLSRGDARLVTSGLHPGRNAIQARYSPGPGMLTSTATIIKTIRPARSMSKVVPSPEASRSALRRISTDPPAGGGPANTTEARTSLDGPTFLGTVVMDQDSTSAGAESRERRHRGLHG